MDYWPWYIGLLWWFSLGSSPLPTMLKLSRLILWPVALQWSNRGMGPFDVPWTSLQMFWRILLYILHHTPPCHIYMCRWLHSFSALDLCPWEPSGGFWWNCLLWSRLALHICYMFFSNFHSALCNKAPLCKDFVVGCLYCCSYSSYGFFGLVPSFWSSPSWVLKQGTCIPLRLYVNVLLLAVVALGLNRWCWPHGEGCLSHFIKKK